MNDNNLPEMKVIPLFTVGELGLERRATAEEAGCCLARISEAQILRWVQFPAGILFFVVVSGDPESGALYILDRKTGTFYWLDFSDQRWGGYTLDDYVTLVRVHNLMSFARCPRLLERQRQPQPVA